MRRLAVVLAIVVLTLGPGAGLVQAQSDDQVIRQAIESVLELDAGRQTARLPRVALDSTSGDLTIVFAMRRPLADDPRQIVASATDDAFTILWAAYSSEAAARVRTTTVLGTYAVVGRYERPREIPLVRAVLSANRAGQLDWTRAYSLNPTEALDLWWIEGELPR